MSQPYADPALAWRHPARGLFVDMPVGDHYPHPLLISLPGPSPADARPAAILAIESHARPTHVRCGLSGHLFAHRHGTAVARACRERRRASGHGSLRLPGRSRAARQLLLQQGRQRTGLEWARVLPEADCGQPIQGGEAGCWKRGWQEGVRQAARRAVCVDCGRPAVPGSGRVVVGGRLGPARRVVRSRECVSTRRTGLHWRISTPRDPSGSARSAASRSRAGLVSALRPTQSGWLSRKASVLRTATLRGQLSADGADTAGSVRLRDLCAHLAVGPVRAARGSSESSLPTARRTRLRGCGRASTHEFSANTVSHSGLTP